jgi:hypothetical protein
VSPGPHLHAAAVLPIRIDLISVGVSCCAKPLPACHPLVDAVIVIYMPRLTILLMFPMALFTQTTTIQGIVTDPSGAAVPDASVVATLEMRSDRHDDGAFPVKVRECIHGSLLRYPICNSTGASWPGPLRGAPAVSAGAVFIGRLSVSRLRVPALSPAGARESGSVTNLTVKCFKLTN